METYVRIRTISGGTFTTGIGLDWSTQFDDGSSSTYPIATTVGEFDTGTLAYGVCCDYGLWSLNPTDLRLHVEASAGAPVQIHVNGVITEITTTGVQTLSLQAGYNVVRFIRSAGPATVAGKAFDPGGTTSQWVSMYFPGADPFNDTIGTGTSPGGPQVGGSGGTL